MSSWVHSWLVRCLPPPAAAVVRSKAPSANASGTRSLIGGAYVIGPTLPSASLKVLSFNVVRLGEAHLTSFAVGSMPCLRVDTAIVLTRGR